jgi:histidyl-tRNA synthetase
VMRVSSRPIAAAVLAGMGITSAEEANRAFQLIDRYDKLGAEEFRRQWQEFAPAVDCDRLLRHLEETDLQHGLSLARAAGAAGEAAAKQFEELWERLRQFQVDSYCAFDLKVVRGLAYYTGPVFELSARQGGLRALLGGGRYDNLTQLLDGPQVPGVGFGMGDAPILELLRELGKLPSLGSGIDVFVIDAVGDLFPKVVEIATQLRRAGLACDFSYRRQAVGKQFSQAEKRGARHAIVVGAELRQRGELTVKDLQAGEQRAIAAGELLADPVGKLCGECGSD